MAAITSTASGNWDTGSTWVGGTAPGDGDTAIIATGHTVTVRNGYNITVGDSPNPAANVITCNTTGALTVAGGATLVVKGCYQGEDGDLTVGAGSTLEFTVPTGLRYWIRTGKTDFDEGEIKINGTAGSRATFKSTADGGVAYIDNAGFIGLSAVTATYCDFTRIGDGTECFAEPALSHDAVATTFSLDHCTLSYCGAIWYLYSVQADHNFSLTNNVWSNTAHASICVLISAAGPTTGTRLIQGNTFDKELKFIETVGWTVEDNYFDDNSGEHGASYPWTSYARNFCRNGGRTAKLHGSVTDCYYLEDHNDGNPLFAMTPAFSSAMNCTVDGTIFEYTGNDAQGDGLSVASAAGDTILTVKNCIVLPNAAGLASASLLTVAGDAGTTLRIEHNTAIGDGNSQGGVVIAEGYNGHAGMIEYCRNNLVWHGGDAAGTILAENGANTAAEGYISYLGYNGWYNLTADYDVDAATVTTDATANDVNVDPQFVDSTRDLASWGSTQGANGTVAGALAVLKANPYLIASATGNLVDWVRAGFAPRNQALKGTGYNSEDIGAVAVANPLPVFMHHYTQQGIS